MLSRREVVVASAAIIAGPREEALRSLDHKPE